MPRITNTVVKQATEAFVWDVEVKGCAFFPNGAKSYLPI
jgi:hypothetical protein